jgi:hypothetical protein
MDIPVNARHIVSIEIAMFLFVSVDLKTSLLFKELVEK